MIHLITVVERASPTLPAFLEHYLDLGVTSIRVHCGAHTRYAIDPVLSRYGIRASASTDPDQSVARQAILDEAARSGPNDWYILADPTDFHRYPEPIETLLARCDASGYDRVIGCVVDRFGPEGTLAAVRKGASLWAQFPLGAYFTYPIQRQDPRHVAVAKGYALLSGISDESQFGWSPCPLERCLVPIHRFQWTDELLPEWQQSLEQGGGERWKPMQRAVDYFDQNEGRVRVADPRLHVAPCDPDYRAWDVVAGYCRHADQLGVLPETVFAGPPPVRVNVGGTAASGYVGLLHGDTYGTRHPVDVDSAEFAAPEWIYQSGRTGEFSYRFHGLAPEAQHLVRLHFTEPEHSEKGLRRFHVYANGALLLSDFDIADAVTRPYAAATQQARVRSDAEGCVTLDFIRGAADNPVVCGIEILPGTFG